VELKYMRADGKVVTITGPEPVEEAQHEDRQCEYNVEILTALLEEYFTTTSWDDGVESTARRVLKYWAEFSGPDTGPEMTTFPATTKGIVLVRNIEFVSLCKHHLLPFYGKAHVAYLPKDLMVGLSKIPRLVQFIAKRPHVQEELTAAIVENLDDSVQTKGSAALVEARHTCLACRGAQSHSASMVTAEVTGKFRKSSRVRNEFYSMLNRESL
jgi:GTP cyclohydrolase I